MGRLITDFVAGLPLSDTNNDCLFSEQPRILLHPLTYPPASTKFSPLHSSGLRNALL